MDIANYIPALLGGFATTLLLTFLSILVGTILGVGVGLLTFIDTPFRILARIYTELLLAVPVLILMIWLYYVVPELSPILALPPFETALVGLSLSASAFIAQIVEGGLGSVPKGQYEAALLLNMPRLKAIRHIILPQALQTMWPPIVVQYITIFKLVPLASIIGVAEILNTAGLIIHRTYEPITIYSLVAVFYIIAVIPLNHLSRKLRARQERTELLGGM